MNSPEIHIHDSLEIWPVIGSQEMKHNPNKRIFIKNYRYELSQQPRWSVHFSSLV